MVLNSIFQNFIFILVSSFILKHNFYLLIHLFLLGLKYLSVKVKEFVLSNKQTTYREIAEKLINALRFKEKTLLENVILFFLINYFFKLAE